MSNVYRCYTEKMPGFDVAAQALCQQLRQEEGIQTLEGVRILCRYDVQGIDEQTYELAKAGVFSEPAADYVYDEQIKVPSGARALIVEALPGQFDMRADSCSQCIALMTQGDRPLVRAATVYILSGGLTDADMDKVRKALINPVECREAAAEKPETLQADYPAPPDVAVLTGLTREDADLEAVLRDYGLAMDLDDLRFLQRYFIDEGRDPTLTELRMIDTYWSDHCRHTTFSTHLTDVDIQDPAVHVSYQEYLDARRELYGDKAEDRPATLMDIATCGAKVLKKRGILKDLDESDEINVCSVRITADVDGRPEPWLLMFKNETHNHPTEIEPFGGAATCLGGAIRDPLSGRAIFPRPCASPARATRAPRLKRPCRASCPSAPSAARRRPATARTATRSALRPALFPRSITRAMSPSASRRALSSAQRRLKTSCAASPSRATSSFCWAGAPAATAAAAQPARARATAPKA